MTADPTVLDRIVDRLVRTLSAGGPDQLRAPFTVAEIVQSLVPYRTYRNELGVDTLQDYEHAVLEMLAGERGWLVCDQDTVAVIRKELGSPDPDTGLLRRLQTVEVRMGAIRMPVLSELRAPIAREGDDSPGGMTARAEPASETPVVVEDTRAVVASEPPRVEIPVPEAPVPEPVKLSDALAIGAVIHREDESIARITPASVASVYGDPIDFRGVRHAPVDVGGVIFLFGMAARELGFNVEAMSNGFPRCEAKRQIAPKKWKRVRIEFELESRQFRDAGRDPAACDLIVCWKDTWPDRPATLDVLALERMLPTLGAQG